jgi:hypothetical protein
MRSFCVKGMRPLLLAGLVCLGGAARAEKVTLTGHFPARVPEASQLRRISVMPFGGNGGGAMASAVRAELVSPGSTGIPWFTIMSEAGIGARSRRVGAEGIVAGSAEVTVADSQFQQRSFECAEYSGRKCVRYGTITCTNRVVSAAIDLRITRLADNRIVYSAAKPMREEIGWCEGGAPGKTADEAFAEIAQAAARDMKRDISPYDESYVLKIKESTDGMSKPVKDRFKSAVKLSVKDLAGSCASWASLTAEAPASASLLYDLGICAEARGDFAAASAYYQQSQSLTPNGNKDTAAAVSRVRLLIAARDQSLQQQNSRQRSEASELRQQADADTAARRQAAAATRAAKASQAAARSRAAAQEAASRSAHDAQRQQVANRYGAGAADAILSRRVEKGMTPAQVQAAIGAPSRRERISAGEEQWFYPGRRIIFSAGKVSYVGS